MTNKNKQSQKTSSVSIGILLLTINILVLFYHSQYGFCQTDEPFYIALVHRLYLGESLIVNEWHPTQLYAPIMLPAYAVFMKIFPEGDYVILYFRILKILFSFLTSILVYLQTYRRYGTVPAVFAGLICQLYSRANINGCSYYNLFFHFVILNAVLLDRISETLDCRNKNVEVILLGVTVSLAVLCNPYYAFFVVSLWLIALCLGNNKIRQICLNMLVGILCTAAIYLCYVFSGISLDDLLTNIKYVFIDPEHTLNIIDKTYMAVTESYAVLGIPAILAFAVNVSLMVKNRDKPFTLFENNIYIISCIIGMANTISLLKFGKCFIILLPFTVLLFPLFLKRIVNRVRGFSEIVYFLGILSAISFMLASSTSIDAMTVGFALCSTGGILMIFDYFQDHSKIGLLSFLRLILAVLIIVPCYCNRLIGIYRDSALPRLKFRIQKGPARGLLTTEEHLEEYNIIYDLIMEQYNNNHFCQVMYSKELPWAYLCNNWGYGSPSAWGNAVSNELLDDYYLLNPDKIPDLVFIFAPEVAGYDTVLFNSHTARHHYELQSLEGWFYDTYIMPGSIVAQNKYVTVYSINK